MILFRKARPTQPWPPLRTDTGSPVACAASKAVRTSFVAEQAATRAKYGIDSRNRPLRARHHASIRC
jgi:hypothetical protein